MWKLTIEDDEGQITPLPLFRDQYTVGRDEGNTIRLTERNISRKHAILHKNADVWCLSDLGSYNGSYVNGVRVVSDYQLSHTDIIHMGDYRLICEDEQILKAAATGPSVPPPRTTTYKPDRLVVVVGPNPGQEYPIHATRLTIGRAAEADVSLPHPSVSRMHAEVQALGGGRYEILDKSSSNGIGVNGSQLRRGLLEAGDFIELGEVKLKFVGAGQMYRPGPEAVALAIPDVRQVPTVRPPPGAKAEADFDTIALPRARRLGVTAAIGAAIGLVIVIGIFALRKPNAPAVPEAPSAPTPAPTDPSRAALADAKRLADQGDLLAAHNTIAMAIASSSPVRDEAAVHEIEGRWADSVIARSDQETDQSSRRALLQSVAQTQTLDPARRKLASDKLRNLDILGTDIRELPRSVPNPTPATAVAASPQGEPREPSAGPKTATRPVLAANPFDTPAAAPEKTQPAAAPAAPVPASATAASRATDLALQGADGEASARAQLEPRVWAGKATSEEIRLLRAICRHMGDRACADRAAAMLAKQSQ
jgi:ABC transport system ATP-binding/permease protein